MLMKELAVSEHAFKGHQKYSQCSLVLKSHLDIVGKWCEWLPHSPDINIVYSNTWPNQQKKKYVTIQMNISP